MAIDKKAVGQRIKLIRQTKGMTLEEFGKLFDASKGNVSLWEKGSSLPSNERIKKIAYIGNMSVDQLIYGDSDIKKSLDEEQTEVLSNYVENKKEISKYERKLFKDSMIEGFLSVIGLGRDSGDKAVEEYEEHLERINSVEEFGKNYIKSNYDNYTYEKYMQEFPNSDSKGYQEYKEHEKKNFLQLLERYWLSTENFNQYYYWINNRFTDQISDELNKISEIAEEEDREHYYVNEVVQPFLDQAAKDFKEYIKDYIDTED